MMFKSTTQPLCRLCGRKIGKHTHRVYFGRPQHRTDTFATERTELPRSKEEAQRLLNEEIVSVSWSRGEEYYARKAGGDVIDSVTTWDGESYRDQFFCTDAHARQFGYATAQALARKEAQP
jgi:hypothetical protein